MKIYVANSGEKHPIRIGANAANFNGSGEGSGGSATSDIRAKVSKGNRESGLRPRLLVLSRETEGGKILYRRVPCLTAQKYNSVALGEMVNYGGSSWQCIAKLPEDY